MELVHLEGTAYPAWEAREAGRVVGAASLAAGSVPSAWHLRLQVEPGSRRRGIGSRLMATATGAARSAGCQTLEMMVVRGSAGERFVARYGAVVGDELIDAVLQMDQVDTARLARFAAGVPDGYQLTCWHDPTPEPLVDSYARVKRVISQAPHRFPPPMPEWTATEVRQAEDRRRANGQSMRVSAILCDDEMVAFTEVVTTGSPQGEQHDTAVVASHRRQGLARCVKADMLLRLRAERPDVCTLTVTYASANIGMHELNRSLGFRIDRRRDLMRLPI